MVTPALGREAVGWLRLALDVPGETPRTARLVTTAMYSINLVMQGGFSELTATVDELRDMLAFYRSPTGQKALRVMPNVIADSVRLSADRMPAVTAEIDRAFRSRLKARGVDLPI